MKKALMTLAVAAFALAANAQFVIGGNIDVNHNNFHSKDYVGGTTTTNISIMPKVGYWLNDKMQVGAQLGWGNQYSRTYTGADDNYTSVSQSRIEFNPYFRYNFATWKKFNLFCEAQINLTLNLEGSSYNKATDNSIDLGNDNTMIGISVTPGLNYAFNSHFSMDLYVNLVGLYWNMTSYGNDDAAHSWGLKANMNAQDINTQFNNFAIGFNYAF